jgi:hypothetical protein
VLLFVSLDYLDLAYYSYAYKYNNILGCLVGENAYVIHVHVGRPGLARHRPTKARPITYLIMGRDVPACVPSHRATTWPIISYVCHVGPNSPKYLNVSDRPIYIQH